MSGLDGKGTSYPNGITFSQLAGGDDSIFGDVQSGTILSAMLMTPNASAATSGVNYHKLFAIGDVTGTTAFGFGDPTKPTTGKMACFGRTTIATGTQVDTGDDVRVINKLVNTGTYSIQGRYTKAKNYSGGTVSGDLVGHSIEVVNDGTVSGKVIGLKMGKDTGSTPDAEIMFTNGVYFVASAAAITANSTTTTAPAGSIGITSHATGVGKLFVSDGSKWQYAAVA